MNPITKLLREQYTKDDLWCSALDRLEYTARNRNLFDHDGYQKEIQKCCEQAFNWHTTAQQQLIDVIIEEMKKVQIDYIISNSECEHCGTDLIDCEIHICEVQNEALQTQITLLEEAKKNV